MDVVLLVGQVGSGTSFLAGTRQSTPQVPREINPVWKHTLMFTQLGRRDVLRFTLRDTGLLTNEHLGGAFGPKIVATATLTVGTGFEGFLEMVPVKDGFGEPVLKLVARFPKYDRSALPPVGTTAAVLEALNMTQPSVETSGCLQPGPTSEQALQQQVPSCSCAGCRAQGASPQSHRQPRPGS